MAIMHTHLENDSSQFVDLAPTSFGSGMYLRLAVFSVAAGIFLGGCKSEYKIHGQVFIVTRAASNLPLGDVPVQFYSDDQIAHWREACAETVRQLQVEVDQTDQSMKEAEDDIKAKKRRLVKAREDVNAKRIERLHKEHAMVREKIDLLTEYANGFAVAEQEVLQRITSGDKIFLKSMYPVSDQEANYITSVSGVEHCYSYYGAIKAVNEQVTIPFVADLDGFQDAESLTQSTSMKAAAVFIARTAPLMDKWVQDILSERYPADFHSIRQMFEYYAAKAATLKAKYGDKLTALNESLKSLKSESAREDAIQKREEDRLSDFLEKAEGLRSSISQQLSSQHTLMDHAFDVKKLSGPAIQTRTDASGTFIVKLNDSKHWTLYSHASRVLNRAEEHYTWFLNIDPKKVAESTIVLSNSNLLDESGVRGDHIIDYQVQ